MLLEYHSGSVAQSEYQMYHFIHVRIDIFWGDLTVFFKQFAGCCWKVAGEFLVVPTILFGGEVQLSNFWNWCLLCHGFEMSSFHGLNVLVLDGKQKCCERRPRREMQLRL